MTVKDVEYNLDGTVSLKVQLPPPPDFHERIDAAYKRLDEFAGRHAGNHWRHVGTFEGPDSWDKMVVLVHDAGHYQGYGGGKKYDGGVVGSAMNLIEAIDDAIAQAKAWEDAHVPVESDQPLATERILRP